MLTLLLHCRVLWDWIYMIISHCLLSWACLSSNLLLSCLASICSWLPPKSCYLQIVRMKQRSHDIVWNCSLQIQEYICIHTRFIRRKNLKNLYQLILWVKEELKKKVRWSYLVREEIKVIYGKPQRTYNGFLLLLVKNAERLLLVIGEFPPSVGKPQQNFTRRVCVRNKVSSSSAHHILNSS